MKIEISISMIDMKGSNNWRLLFPFFWHLPPKNDNYLTILLVGYSCWSLPNYWWKCKKIMAKDIRELLNKFLLYIQYSETANSRIQKCNEHQTFHWDEMKKIELCNVMMAVE